MKTTTFRGYLKLNPKQKTSDIEARSKEAALSIVCGILGVGANEVVVVPMVPLTCGKCGYSWQYKGVRRSYATCAQCMLQVKLGK